MSALDGYVQELEKLDGKICTYGKDWLRTWDMNDETIRSTLNCSWALEELIKNNVSCKIFKSGLGASIFRDNSTRTRFSFASATSMLGLSLSDLDEGKSQISHGETVRETATMISFFTEAIGIRDDLYLGAGHKYMLEVGESITESAEKKVLFKRPCIINLQCDEDHPTQAMADLSHLVKVFGSLEALRGKKIVMSWAYSPSYGKPLSVPQGFIALLSRFGTNLVLAHPEGYDLIPEIIEITKKNAEKAGGSFEISHNMREAFKGADVVYPKSWAPMWISEKRTQQLKKKDYDGLKATEKECLELNKKYIDWQCDDEMMATTKDGKALYMHCLPADISGLSCERGEITNECFQKNRLDTYFEASHKPFIIASMIMHCKCKSVAGAIKGIIARNEKNQEF
ncbi:carbamoyl transferase Z4209, putative [Trichomonas vaginalis G3]|uniref:ornithine carbamoyltransferase n=1 Tax=Trichomonas vaginalis (strain ATCC PRA-98 / G3) TaxID=412133 RepID=A2DY09_TRIV3|nr:knotted carbamoyltransferase YgeW family [Trichomonas vaginalis G3]EAY14745.1 carbamoyl transferase Z4209, putative [Trichomonas vaginalis G3]KAI5487884.1 knotted carbamoyltransferase YgeW family [Trichomonas vaginalis G3]|eukprot:XP_001326968.1 carbamoyl transferase Z4209 [Trichomonas vaginalis G3]